MVKQQKKRDCVCSGHPRGRPKVGHGPCYLGQRPATRLRIRGKRAERAWLRSASPEDEEM